MESSTAPPVGQDLFAVESRLTALEGRVDALEQKGAQVPGGAPEPTNEGENLERTPGSPELDPHQPGVEPGNAPDPAPNAPSTTDPQGDTAKQNAPEAPAPEPDGANVATNPGTESGSDAQTEVPGGGSSAVGETTATAPATVPAAEAAERPLYVDVTADRSATWSYTPPFTLTNLVTPDGRPLYHYEGDNPDKPGEPGTGAKDGMIGIYADDVVVPDPANSGDEADKGTPAEGASA